MNGAPERQVVGVSRVAAYIGRMIAESKNLRGVAVQGEVSSLSNKNGRLYFDLKEGGDVLNCVVWSNAVAKLPPFNNGDEVIVSGDFGTYAARSSYQLSVTALEQTGIGRLYAQVEALRKRLLAEGLFDASRKRAMPSFPLRVALVSARGLGAEDFETTMAKRAPHIAIRFIETRVQGVGASIDIGEAIDKASELDVDVIVVARGGGSFEDLFAFNEEPVVRAIVRAKHPVLTAIAHTANIHLADLAADKVAETPSNGAQYFGEIREAYARRLARLLERLDRAPREKQRARQQRYDYATAALQRIAREYTGRKRQRVLVLERRLAAQTPAAKLGARERRVADLHGRLRALARNYTVPLRARAQVLGALLESHDPQRPLKHGFAMVFHEGVLVRDARSVPVGARIETRLERGTLASRVEGHIDE
ncbi:MAG TPA: exodeoxyribonuclease VII large subunit [Candidatus Acidoferrales bacterium]|nr:exodeoxyribonuclease VII large subunit [Candidatus Acidoferrales bacterium]